MTRLLALLLLLTPALATAQDDATAALVVETDGAAVFVAQGDATLGPFAPGAVVRLPAGDATVTAVDDAAAWDALRASAEVALGAGDTVWVVLPLPVRYRVETVPLGAALSVDGRAAGTAPQAVVLPRGTTATLTARLPDHADATATLGGDGGHVVLRLRPTAPEAAAVTLLPTQRRPRTRTWIDVGVGTLAVAAGAVAVHYKFRADALDDRYRAPDSPERGDEALRERAEALDVRSGVALGVMQGALGVLALRFVLR